MIIYNLYLVILTNKQQPKTYNERKLEEEQKILEENQKQIAMEYEASKEDLKKNYKSCKSQPEISQDRQQECYKGESVSERVFLFHIIICVWLKNHVNTPCLSGSQRHLEWVQQRFLEYWILVCCP